MLTTDVERYLSLRKSLGFKLLQKTRLLRAFAQFALARGDTHVRTSTALAWAAEASTPRTGYIRLASVAEVARFLQAEDSGHEVPPLSRYPSMIARPSPYIYSPEELVSIVEAAGRLHRTYPLRRETYTTLFGLIASTGMRVSEALNLRFDDIQHGGVLRVREAKFGKSRLLPLHSTAADALNRYLAHRRKLPVTDDHLFLSAGGRRISRSMVNYTFRRVARLAGIVAVRQRPCRIHDLRHTFATRSLEACATRRSSVGRHFVALATYLGHADITHTYWYFEATSQLMTDIAAAAEALVAGEVG
jgi:integrase/recombinase XerD